MRLAAAALLAALAPLPALATGMSMNHVVMPQGTSLQACVARGTAAIASVGLRALSTTQTSTWGEGTSNEGTSTLYAVYCLPNGSVAFVVGAADRFEMVDSTITAIRNALQNPGVVTGPSGPTPGLGGQRK